MDKTPYTIGGITFLFPQENKVTISYNDNSITGYFPWQDQRDKNTCAWIMLSMLEVVGERNLDSFRSEWSGILTSEEAERIYKSGKRMEEEFFSLGLSNEHLSNVRRVASLCMTDGRTPTEIAQQTFAQLKKVAFHSSHRDR